jgi:hypothetical protein
MTFSATPHHHLESIVHPEWSTPVLPLILQSIRDKKETEKESKKKSSILVRPSHCSLLSLPTQNAKFKWLEQFEETANRGHSLQEEELREGYIFRFDM